MLSQEAIATKRLDRSGDIRSMSESEVLAKLGGVRNGWGDPIEEFDDLENVAFASGNYGFVADIPPDESGKRRVIKIEKKPEIVNLTGKDGHRSRDVADAASLSRTRRHPDVPGVVAPSTPYLSQRR